MLAKRFPGRPAPSRAAIRRMAASAAAGVLLTAASPAWSAESACSPSLADVLSRIEASPRVAAAGEDTLAHRELARQAGARPNPELILELEDFTGSGPYSDFGQSQTTLSFAQKIELGGVRDRRVEAADRETDAVAARSNGEKVQALATAKQRYVEVVAAAESLATSLEAERLAREFADETKRRGASAVASEADVARARVALDAATLSAANHRRDLAIASERLTATWGGSPSDADCYAKSPAPGSAVLPSVRIASPAIEAGSAPAVTLAEAEVDKARADVALARAAAAPDLQVGAGLRYHAYDDASAVAELRVEVPIFDRNEGAIAAAERKLSAAQSRALAVRRETEARIGRLRETLDAAASREHAIATSMIPAAEEAAVSLQRTWQNGAASTFEVIEARRAVLDLRQQRIDAASEYFRTLAALEAATGNVTPSLGGTPARKSGTPARKSGTPARKSGTPVRKGGTPVRKEN